METFYTIMFFIIGTVFGSFYNVVGLRIPNKENLIKPGSHCPRCGHELKWYELIPIISFLCLGGKCKNCKEKISSLYPLNEFFSGILFALSYHSWGFSLDLAISLILCSFLIIVIASDLSYMIIPDSFIIVPSILIVLVKLIQVGPIETLKSIGYGLLAFGVMYLIMKLGNLIFKKESLGGADIKLMFLSGLILGPMLSLVVIVIASLFALPPSIYLYFKNKETIIPFGPFLVIGILLLFFSKLNFQEFLNLFIKF